MFIIICIHSMVRISSFNFGLILILTTMTTCIQSGLDSERSVYSIPYLSTYRQDLIQKSMGCGLNIMYSSYTHPTGARDAAHIVMNPYLYGGARCQPRQMYLKAFGYGQKYEALQTAESVAAGLKRALAGKYRGVVIDWKNPNAEESVSFLDSLTRQLLSTGLDVYLKVPASYLCKLVGGRYFIDSFSQVKKVIVEMYGQEPHAYKTANQMFLSEVGQEPATQQYPESRCPKYPSYLQLSRISTSIDFYIEKTLKQEEDGYIGQELLQKILAEINGLYTKKIFYDAYPPSIIRI